MSKPTDPIVRLLFWLLVVLCAASFLEFKGPYKGWLTARLGTPSAPEPAFEEPAPAPIEPVEELVVEPPVEPVEPITEEPPKSEMELLYDRLYGKYFAKYSPPKPGATLKLKLRSGDTVTGTLAEVSPGRVKIGMKFGTMTYALHLVHPSMYPYLFPERAAKMQALKELEQILADRQAAEDAKLLAQQTVTPEPVIEPPRIAETKPKPVRPKKPKPQPAPSFVANDSGGDLRYDPSESVTPEHLQRTLQAFGMRLRYQQRALGAPIAKKIYAKQQNSKVVLYMEMSRTFQAQDYDVRYAIADQLWNIWSMRCRETGKIRGANGAHLVMIDQSGKQIGGSTEQSAADIWVKQGKG